MVEDHNGLNNGRISDEAFLRQCDDALAERTRMMIYELERFEAGLFFCLFDTPDRVHHMFKRDGQRVVEEHYRSCDAIIGRVMEYVDEETLLIVLSDHGMNSFERGFNLNTWLHDQGLLAMQSGFSPGADAGDLLRAVDWSRTKAYALGLSGIYLNLKGREERGIVERGEAADLTAAIARELAGLGDPARNTVAIRSVKTRDQLYRGAYADEAADLVVNYAGGYRVSWATSLGGIPATQFEDNVKKWSGDHFNFRRLMGLGTYGRLESIIPPITVPAWMCMATSQDPGSLGVYGFRNRTDHSYNGLDVVNAKSIRDLTIWDQIAREGRRSYIIGVPPSFPPRKINGVCIGCFLTPDTGEDNYTHPPEVKGRIKDLVGDYPVDVKGFRTERKDWLRDEIYEMSRKHFTVIRQMLRENDWDYFQFVEIGLDRLQHGFWKYHDPSHVLHEPDNQYSVRSAPASINPTRFIAWCATSPPI
jgi:predicted AlkP superfamily phosphohydrolase/phosphomutase